VTARAAVDVVHNAKASRFEATVDGKLCFAAYDRVGDVLRISHTSVPSAVEGRGVAAALVRAAFDHARENGLQVEPWCSYVRAYMRRHPETRAFLPSDFKL
jgi:predicted GNAT family acetyltransferase